MGARGEGGFERRTQEILKDKQWFMGMSGLLPSRTVGQTGSIWPGWIFLLYSDPVTASVLWCAYGRLVSNIGNYKQINDVHCLEIRMFMPPSSRVPPLHVNSGMAPTATERRYDSHLEVVTGQPVYPTSQNADCQFRA